MDFSGIFIRLSRLQIWLLFILLLILSFVLGNSGNFYFVTHTSYTSLTLSSQIIATYKILGSTATVTQQCRRNCALFPSCQAFDVTLVRNSTDLGTFTCRFFASNACNWTTTALVNTSVSPGKQLWEKLEATPTMKPKACNQYCAVRYKGNCLACRGFPKLAGLDCDIAPKLCSDYNVVGWSDQLVWPWGFYGPSFKVNCLDQFTTFLSKSPPLNGTAVIKMVHRSGWTVYPNLIDFQSYSDVIRLIDWEFISFLTSFSVNKTLRVRLTTPGIFSEYYSGFELSPYGELSLKGSLPETTSPGIPTPLHKVPFVYDPVGFNETCGAFWQFHANVPLCSGQTTHLLSFKNLVLSRTKYPVNAMVLFMVA